MRKNKQEKNKNLLLSYNIKIGARVCEWKKEREGNGEKSKIIKNLDRSWNIELGGCNYKGGRASLAGRF